MGSGSGGYSVHAGKDGLMRIRLKETPERDIRIKLAHSGSIKVNVKESKGVYNAGDPYTGEYEVTPAVTDKILKTKQKLLSEDITIKSIPYIEIPNETGTTVIIGG